MRPLLACWDALARRLSHARQIVLFLDFDGTLVPIVAQPKLARLGARRRAFLAGLAADDSLRVVVVSGRALADLVARVRVRGVEYYGNHGAEARDVRGRRALRPPPRARAVIRSVARSLASRLRGARGILLEDKGPALAVHYRSVAQRSRRPVLAAIEEVARTYRGRVERRRGKEMVELRVRGLPDKGDAVRRTLARAPRDVLALYFGDDVTDRDAFRVLRRSGVTVQVGATDDTRAAEYSLEDPRNVWEVLRRVRRCRKGTRMA